MSVTLSSDGTPTRSVWMSRSKPRVIVISDDENDDNFDVTSSPLTPTAMSKISSSPTLLSSCSLYLRPSPSRSVQHTMESLKRFGIDDGDDADTSMEGDVALCTGDGGESQSLFDQEMYAEEVRRALDVIEKGKKWINTSKRTEYCYEKEGFNRSIKSLRSHRRRIAKTSLSMLKRDEEEQRRLITDIEKTLAIEKQKLLVLSSALSKEESMRHDLNNLLGILWRTIGEITQIEDCRKATNIAIDLEATSEYASSIIDLSGNEDFANQDSSLMLLNPQ